MTDLLLLFATNHPVNAVLLTANFVFIIYVLVHMVLKASLLALDRVLRSINILVRGWPPTHLDANGDHIEVEVVLLDKPQDKDQ